MNEKVIAYSTDENYVKYMCVSLTSLVYNTSSNNSYRIVVLHGDISEKSIDLIKSIGVGHLNIKFEFHNVKELFLQKLYCGNWSVATYYRFALVDLLTDIDKVLYLDCDTIVMTDVAKVFDTNLTGCYFAAVRDSITYSNGDGTPERVEYCEKVLKLQNTYDYVNAGVQLFNLPEFRKDYDLNKLISITASYDYKWVDQDVLNMIAQGKICFLDFKWNFFSNLKKEDFISDEMRNVLEEAGRQPYIIHYALGKPWVPRFCFCEKSKCFWKYAFRSVVADEVWNDFCKKNDYLINDLWLNELRVINEFYAGNGDFMFFLRFAKAYIIGLFRKLKVRSVNKSRK